MDTYPSAGGPAGPDATGAHGDPAGPAAAPHAADGPPPGAGPAAGAPAYGTAGTGTPNGFFAAVRRTGLYRGDDRWVGGVCDGLARRFGLDPLLVRGLFAVSVLLGGLGLVVYGVAWALLPEQRDGRIHLEEMVAGRFDVALLGALGFALVGLARGDHWFWFWSGPPEWLQVLLWLAFVGGLIALVVTAANRRGTPVGAAPGAPTPQPWAGQASAPADPWVKQPHAAAASAAPGATTTAPVGPPAGPPAGPTVAYGPYGPYRQQGAVPPPPPLPPQPPIPPRPPVPPKPRRSGPGVGTVGVVVALTLIGLAVLLMAERTGDFDGPVLLTTLGLGVVLAGLGIIVSGLRGRSSGVLGFLAIMGILVALPVGAAQNADWRWTDGSYRDLSAGTTDVDSRRVAAEGFELGFGDAVLDLTGVPMTSTTLDVPVSFGAGSLTIIVPADAAVTADVDAGVGNVVWELDGAQRSVDGVGIANHTFEDEQSRTGDVQLALRVSIGAGDVRITEES
ncbi:PspC domain-containing protein [Cellulomonas biazotea]|uniref:PspC domain-containing protein n=2 Tax=Cellulomonas biazotea TaxID=1709 RepID=UPI0035E56A49